MSEAKTHYSAADVRYVAAFDANASPARLHLALALADTAWNPADRDRLTVVDIGCGRGLTPCVLAAANPGWDVIGIDLQPVHVAEAREIAAEAGLDNARFIEADLAELDEDGCAGLVPEIDIVICHGVWTWVPDSVRQGIVRLLKSRVRAGGIVLMGYNSLPGFSDCIVLQRVLREAARGVAGTEAERGAHALGVLEWLREAGAAYLPDPNVLDKIIRTARVAPAYMAHEWFSEFWRPVFHADLARDLAAARLDYAGPVRPSAGLVELQLRPRQQAALASPPAGMDRETLVDCFLDRRFRTDIFVRGRRAGGLQALGDIRFALGVDPAGAAVMSLGTQVGVASLSEAQHRAIVGALTDGPRRLRDLAALPEAAGLTPSDIALMLSETFTAHPLWRDPPSDPELARRAARCNATLVRRLLREAQAGAAPLGAVVPAFGSGFAMPAPDLALVVALQSGAPADPDHLAPRLSPRPDDPEAVAVLRAAIAGTLDHHLAPWRALGLL
ncbi:class I SAM-dependent methyltransferase [Roseomonas sp. HF4]|uniref:class I SAM-dependent methyltransferase n=1 Tax=Roseomonas sp. HF4 TaxID=2562313 RepID=UPI00148546F6|nr:class I SAM-dependent methyltransferase [Roseomonas sp. HF4]